ncbi:MAG: acylphosphatase [Gammaproteobacteria bacterium]
MNEPRLRCVRCLVSGRVQGVYFRADTRQQAIRLGLTGWVRNRPDGRVEVLACGPVDAIGEFHRWLWQGPEEAQVSNVQCRDEPPGEYSGFEVLRNAGD